MIDLSCKLCVIRFDNKKSLNINQIKGKVGSTLGNFHCWTIFHPVREKWLVIRSPWQVSRFHFALESNSVSECFVSSSSIFLSVSRKFHKIKFVWGNEENFCVRLIEKKWKRWRERSISWGSIKRKKTLWNITTRYLCIKYFTLGGEWFKARSSSIFSSNKNRNRQKARQQDKSH